MIEFRSKKPRLSINLDGTITATFTTARANLQSLDGLPTEKELTVTVKEYKPKRTLTQNAYLWAVLGDIAAAAGISKEDVYRSYIKDYGVYEVLPIKNEAAESFIAKWGKNGIGWFCEDIGESKLDGYTKIIAYFGSSTYTTAEMARIIDAVVYDAEEMGIQTMTAQEWSLLNNENG